MIRRRFPFIFPFDWIYFGLCFIWFIFQQRERTAQAFSNIQAKVEGALWVLRLLGLNPVKFKLEIIKTDGLLQIIDS